MPDYIPVEHDPFADDAGAMSPETYVNPFVRDFLGRALTSVATLPQRAFEASETMRRGEGYDPGPILEAATLPMGTGAVAGVPLRAGETALGAGPIRAYHGSPHDFDRFDLSKIGTGEGAQAYGHGLYFAENPETAKSYANALGAGKIEYVGPEHSAADLRKMAEKESDPDTKESLNYAAWLRDSGYDAKKAIETSIPSWKQQELFGSDSVKTRGPMYEVQINADPAQFLDWDQPLKDQPSILEAAKRIGPDVARRVMRERYSQGKQFNDIVANEGLPLGQATDANISAAMQQAGIPGIRYLDQGSRFQPQQVKHLQNQIAGLKDLLKQRPNDLNVMRALEGRRQELTAMQPTYNYVIFDDKLIDIIRKYGLAGLSALPPATASVLQQHLTPVDHDPFNGS